jgi:hypothetical protein
MVNKYLNTILFSNKLHPMSNRNFLILIKGYFIIRLKYTNIVSPRMKNKESLWDTREYKPQFLSREQNFIFLTNQSIRKEFYFCWFGKGGKFDKFGNGGKEEKDGIVMVGWLNMKTCCC